MRGSGVSTSFSNVTATHDLDVSSCVAEAEAAAAEGRMLDALDLLARLDRRHRDSAVEQRIVEIRHAAFDELPKEAGHPSWPLELADPFPGLEGVPEVAAGDLSAEVLGGAVVNHGCLRVNELLAPDDVARFVDHIDRSFAARERIAEGATPESVAPDFVPFEPGKAKAAGFGNEQFVRTVDVPGALSDLVDAFTGTGVRDAVASYLGERPAMIANKWVLRRSQTGMAMTDFHQDGAFLGEGIRTIDCWIALSDCGPGTGRPGIDLVPGRFEVLPTGEGSLFPWSLAEGTVLETAAGIPVASPVFNAGDAIFFDERLPHRTAVGTDLTTRYAIESWFVAPSSYPSKHVPVVL